MTKRARSGSQSAWQTAAPQIARAQRIATPSRTEDATTTAAPHSTDVLCANSQLNATSAVSSICSLEINLNLGRVFSREKRGPWPYGAQGPARVDGKAGTRPAPRLMRGLSCCSEVRSGAGREKNRHRAEGRVGVGSGIRCGTISTGLFACSGDNSEQNDVKYFSSVFFGDRLKSCLPLALIRFL